MKSSEFKKLSIEFLRLLAITWKNLWLYSEYHPLGKSSLKKCYNTLRLILNERSEFSVGTAEDKILAEDMVVDEEKYVMSSIAKEFSKRNIFSLVFFRGLSREDFKSLFDILIMHPEQIKKMGGLANIIEQRKINFIQANTVRFGRITESQELVDIALAEHILTGAKVPYSSLSSTLPGAKKTGNDSVSMIFNESTSESSFEWSVDELMSEPSKISVLFAKTLEKIGLESKSASAKKNDIFAAMENVGKILHKQAGGNWNKLKVIFARLLLSLKPEIQKFVIEESHSDSIRDSFLKNLFSYLPEEKIGDLIATQYAAGLKDTRDLADFITKLIPSKEKREQVLPILQKKLMAAGATEEKIETIRKEIDWLQLTTDEKVKSILTGEQIWKKPFSNIMEILEETSRKPSKNECITLIQKYISGLIHPSNKIRKDVIENTIPLYVFMKGHKDFSSQRFKIQNLFFRRLKDERDLERFENLVKSIIATAASEMDTGDYSEFILILEKLKSCAFEEFRNNPSKRELIASELSQMIRGDLLNNVLEEFLSSTKEMGATFPKLFEIFGDPSIQFLIERLSKEQNRKKRYKIVSLIKSLKQKALPQLLNYLDDERWFLVRNVIFILGEIADATLIKFLKESLHHADHKVRRETVRAIIKIGGEEALALTISAIDDPDPFVAITAIESLGTVRYKKAIKKMLHILSRNKPYEDASDLLRIAAIENLGKLKVKEAVPGFIQIIKKRSLLGISEEANLRLAAIKALAEVGGEKAREVLIYASEKDPLASIRKIARDFILESKNERL